MNKVAIISFTFVVLIGAGIVYLVTSNTDNSSSQTTEAPVSQQQTSSEPAQQEVVQNTAVQTSAYVDYQDGLIEQTEGTKMLFFHADWCPQCRALEADINEQGVPNGVTIMKVDFDSNQALRQKYGVTLQTTVVLVDDNGELVKKYTAYQDPTLQSVLDNLL